MASMLRNSRRALAAFAAPAALLVPRGPPTTRCDQPAQKEEKKRKNSSASNLTMDETIMSAAPPWKREWNTDWDGRHPSEGEKYEGKVRHILLIRHGQYDLEDSNHGLTPLGFQQAEITGKRLAATSAGKMEDVYGEVKITYAALVTSTILRAQQTAEVIQKALPDVPRFADDPILAEGFPVLPMPQGPSFLKEGRVFPATVLEEAPRLEAAFRKYVRRDVDHKKAQRERSEEKLAINEAYVPQEKEKGKEDAPSKDASALAKKEGSDKPVKRSSSALAMANKEHEYVVVVCHMNVIRYFVARALQLPPEVWLRMRGNNCGITEIIIQPSGQVSLGSFADVGHLSIEQVTFH